MKIGLIDVDSHNFPNLALMKISTYHKNNGDNVEWYDIFKAIEEEYDIVYLSKVFDDTYSEPYIYPIYAKKIIKGGYGYNNYEKPFQGYEGTMPDYSIYYGIYPKYINTAFGYLTRGCPRNCDFCMVGKYEGIKSREVCNLNIFFNKERHKEIKLLDPNLFANKNSVNLLRQLKDSNVYIDFTQGLDIRLLKKEHIKILNEMKLKILHFAWDNMKQSNYMIKLFKEARKHFKYDKRKLRVYVLTNFDTTFEEDLFRILMLKDIGYDPYVMIYNKPNAPKKIKQVQRWVNNKFIWYSGKAETFEEYLKGGF